MKDTIQNLEKMQVRDFAKKIICDGHLFYVNKEGRKYYLMKPGVYIDPEFIKKHAPHNTIFDYQSVVKKDVKDKFTTLFKELRYLRFEKDLRLKSAEIAKFFVEYHSSGEHILNFALACFEEFNCLSPELVLKLHQTDVYLFRKALYSAAFAIIIAIGNDHYQSQMLKDFYNLTLSLDMGLCDANYSFYVSEACNVENQKPGKGKDWLVAEKATELELKVFMNHPQKSYAFHKSHPEILSYPELAEIMLYQHELSNGEGFPRGIPKSLISNWEAVVLLADSMVDIKDEYQFETSVLDHLKNFTNQKLDLLPVNKVYQKLMQNLLYFAGLKETGT